MFGVGLTLPKISAVLLNAIGGLLAAYKINDLTPDLVADFNGSLNDGTEFYDAGGTVDTFAELITHSRAGNATMTDGYGPELASNVVADWVPFGGGSAVQDGEWIVITGVSANSSGVTLPLATEVGKQYAWTMEIELLTATGIDTQLQQPTNSSDAFSPNSYDLVTTNKTIIYQGIHTHTTAGSKLAAWPRGVGLTARIRNVSVREVPAIKWAPHNLLTYSEDFTNAAWTKNNCTESSGLLTATGSTAFIKSTISSTQHIQTFEAVVSSGTSTFPYIVLLPRSATDVGNQGGAYFNLTTGTVHSTEGTAISADIVALDSGEYRISLKVDTSASTSVQIEARLGFGNVAGSQTTIIGNTLNVSKTNLYRSDLGGMVDNPETGDSYVPTTSSAVYLPRRNHHVYNGDDWVNEGVLHESEARTNLSANPSPSNGLGAGYTTNTETAAPSGVVEGFKITAGGGTSVHSAYWTPVTFTTTAHTCSLYIKQGNTSHGQLIFGTSSGLLGVQAILNFATGVLTTTVTSNYTLIGSEAENVGNGWYRVHIAMTSPTSQSYPYAGPSDGNSSWVSNTGTEFMYAWGIQTEAGSTPSSYIPTNGATVTRAAETLTIPAANMPWPEPNYIGPELVVNGGFSSGTTDWTTNGDVSISVVGGELQLVRNTTGYQAYQAVSTQVGAIYVISSKARVSTADYAYFGASTISGGANLLSINTPSASMVTLSGFFVATGTTTYILLGSGNAGDKTVYFDNISVREIDPLSVSIQMNGRMTYADTDNTTEVALLRWGGVGNWIRWELQTLGTNTGRLVFQQAKDAVYETLTTDAYFPGVLVPYNIASRHGSTFINGAVDGVALTADTTPTGLVDLSATDFNLGYDYMGTISMLRVWADDLADVGIAEATEPSEVPSLQLTFDNSETSFTIQDWEQ